MRLLRFLFPISLLAWFCVRYIDRPVALFVRDYLYGNREWTRLTSNLPDALLIVVAVISLTAFIGRLYRQKKLLNDALTRFLGHIALSLPVSYGVRAILKYSFGRQVTRAWLHNTRVHEFHWFHGGAGYNGFPSGHMIVFATLCAAVGRYYPRYKCPCYLLLGGLGLLLIATNYHFVADVIVGTYAGFLVEAWLEMAQPAAER